MDICVKEGQKVRPKILITESQLKLLYDEGLTASKIAKCLACSTKTVYKNLYALNLPIRARYTQISDDELKLKISEIHAKYHNAGQTMNGGYLEAMNIHVPRKKVRQFLTEVDPIGTASRWSQSIQRRTYNVATPNFLTHGCSLEVIEFCTEKLGDEASKTCSL
ncbi:hypothetical protein KQX54_002030 [Cotesia glomerata]|uniref:Resolvase HTH domain-containing protein n=1 Tax=Cotesia glomerata TaxID=32391 RepID=A0AAV7IIQ8_COTGL|nr:hypothetical protein KQX54_002030 [Cotesia glomerata]